MSSLFFLLHMTVKKSRGQTTTQNKSCCNAMFLKVLCSAGSNLDLIYWYQVRVRLNHTLLAQRCLRNHRRALRLHTTSSWEVTSTGLYWCPEVSDCTRMNRFHCFWRRTPTLQMDTGHTCPPGCASKGDKQTSNLKSAFFSSHKRVIPLKSVLFEPVTITSA